jgi:hypothetical protein
MSMSPFARDLVIFIPHSYHSSPELDLGQVIRLVLTRVCDGTWRADEESDHESGLGVLV